MLFFILNSHFSCLLLLCLVVLEFYWGGGGIRVVVLNIYKQTFKNIINRQDQCVVSRCRIDYIKNNTKI